MATAERRGGAASGNLLAHARAERRAPTHGHAPGEKTARTRTKPQQDWGVRSPVPNRTHVREIGKTDE